MSGHAAKDRAISSIDRGYSVTADRAVWCHTGLPPVPVRGVLIRGPQGRFDTQALLCTDPAVAPAQILT